MYSFLKLNQIKIIYFIHLYNPTFFITLFHYHHHILLLFYLVTYPHSIIISPHYLTILYYHITPFHNHNYLLLLFSPHYITIFYCHFSPHLSLHSITYPHFFLSFQIIAFVNSFTFIIN